MLLNFINLFGKGAFSEFEDQKVYWTKIRPKKIAQEKFQFQFNEKSLGEKRKRKKECDCRRAERSQSETFETKINEDKKKWLISGPKGQPPPDYKARTYVNSVWWRNLKSGDFVLGRFDNLHWGSLFDENFMSSMAVSFHKWIFHVKWTTVTTMKAVLMLTIKHLPFCWGSHTYGKRFQPFLLLEKIMICWLNC